MAEIKAFVAHSFSDSDKELTGIFVEHFRNLADLVPGFSWDSARQAEPGSVSEKVLARIEGKNVFIGICTRHECVISSAVSPLPFFKRVMRFNEVHGQWKTSDWLIQEIGLAVGRGMKVIIFLEEGVRTPGALFGDIEYISFARANPHASFDKLLQMLGALSPKEKNISAVAEGKSATGNKPKEAEEPGSNWEPQSDWNQKRYERAAFRAIVLNRDQEDFEKIDKAYKTSPFAKGINVTIWEARVEFLRMLGDQRADFKKIKKAAEDNPNNSELLFFLAIGYREYGQHEIAARTFERAATNSDNESEKRRFSVNAASQYARAGLWARAREIVEALKGEVGGKADLQYDLLSSLRDLAEIEKSDALQLAIMEQMVELHPSDISLRFSLAFKHSEFGNSDMALHHYLRIPIFERDPITWNNIGASYGDFHMSAKAIGAFRLSEEKNETLAMCNIGFKLLQSGFLAEAQQLAERALAIKPHHENVPELLKRLAEVPREEDKKLTETLEKTKEKAAFYQRLGAGVLRKTPVEIARNWNSPDGVVEAKMDGTSIRLFGAHERPISTLGSLLAGPVSGLGVLGSVTAVHRIEYSGELRGTIFVGQVKRWRDGEQPSLLSAANDSVKVLMVLSDDHTEISVMENPGSMHARFYCLTRTASIERQ
jgi:tetratricopeptide (TPR) repeat protein